VHAEEEYRKMLEDFPDSPLIPRAKQKLREVQEVLAQRQFEIGEYYASRENWAASIARLQTVADSYPLFSRNDEALITLGDAYANQAQMASHLRLAPKAKAELIRYYDDRATQAWDRVVTRYPLAPHVEDAKDRLIAMGRNVPDASPQALAESQAEEDSRVSVKLGARTLQLVGRGPNTVKAARVGEPSLNSPAPVLPNQITQQTRDAYVAAIKGQPIPEPAAPAAQTAAAPAPAAAEASPASGGALTLQEVPDANGSPGSTVTVEVPNSGSSGGGSAAPEGAPGGASPANNAIPHSNAEPLAMPVGPTNNQPLPAVDKPAEAPQQVNQVPAGAAGAQVNTGANASGKPTTKKKKEPYDKKDESSSKHKKKTGLDKVNPF